MHKHEMSEQAAQHVARAGRPQPSAHSACTSDFALLFSPDSLLSPLHVCLYLHLDQVWPVTAAPVTAGKAGQAPRKP